MAMDMVTMSIIDSAMVAVCREMGLNVQKTAYSTLFSEAKDFTCALAVRRQIIWDRWGCKLMEGWPHLVG